MAKAEPHLRVAPAVDTREALRLRKAEVGAAIAACDRRRTAAWRLAEDGDLASADLRARLDALAGEEAALREQLHAVDAEIAQQTAARNASRSLAHILADLPRIWGIADVETQKEIARAVAALPAVGGLFADPDRRHDLLIGADLDHVPQPRKADVFRAPATWDRLRLLTHDPA